MNIANPVVSYSRAATIACALWAASASALSHADARDEELEETSLEALKVAYLTCDQGSINGQLSSADIMQCSIIYEALKQRAFGGDFERLLAWSRAHPSMRTIGR